MKEHVQPKPEFSFHAHFQCCSFQNTCRLSPACVNETQNSFKVDNWIMNEFSIHAPTTGDRSTVWHCHTSRSKSSQTFLDIFVLCSFLWCSKKKQMSMVIFSLNSLNVRSQVSKPCISPSGKAQPTVAMLCTQICSHQTSLQFPK